MTKSWYLIVRYRCGREFRTLRERATFNHMIGFFFRLPFTCWNHIEEVKIKRLEK